jgi:polyisoprenoid-binding protein YceI
MKLLLLTFIFLNIAHANKNCTYTIDETSTKISWKAFKTPKKVGVGGEFKKFKVNSFGGKNIEALLQSASFSIDPKSTATGDKGRDIKIVQFFFGTLAVDGFIKGIVKKVSLDKVTVSLYMNGVTRDEPLTLTKTSDTGFIVSGNIDVLNYSMSGQLGAINKACYKLHEGKTWSDVDIAIQANVKKECN